MNHINHILNAPGHPATNGQAENSVKTVKKSIRANLANVKPDSVDVILNRFLFDYRITVHSTTGISPAESMCGRQLKSRFSLLKPPRVKDKIISSQDRNVQNSHGKRDSRFDPGQKVYIRDYTNPDKPSWTRAEIKNSLGSRHYDCVIAHNGREIKRHLNRIREAHEANTDQISEEELNPNANETENQGAQEHVEKQSRYNRCSYCLTE